MEKHPPSVRDASQEIISIRSYNTSASIVCVWCVVGSGCTGNSYNVLFTIEPTAKQISVSCRRELSPFPFIQADVPPWFITTDLLEWTHKTTGFFVVTAWFWWMWRRFFHKRRKKAQTYCRRAFVFRDSILIHSLFLRISKHPILVLLFCLSVFSPTSYHSITNECCYEVLISSSAVSLTDILRNETKIAN